MRSAVTLDFASSPESLTWASIVTALVYSIAAGMNVDSSHVNITNVEAFDRRLNENEARQFQGRRIKAEYEVFTISLEKSGEFQELSNASSFLDNFSAAFTKETGIDIKYITTSPVILFTRVVEHGEVAEFLKRLTNNLDSVTTTSTTNHVATGSQSGPDASQSLIVIIMASAAILICMCAGLGIHWRRRNHRRSNAEPKNVDVESGAEQSGPLPNLLPRQSSICQNEQEKSPTPALQVQCPPVTMPALQIKCPSRISQNGQDKSQAPALPVTLPSPVLELSTKPSLSIADIQPDMDWECGSVGSPARPSKLDAHKEQIQSCFLNRVLISV